MKIEVFVLNLRLKVIKLEKIEIITNIIELTNPEYSRRSVIEWQMRFFYRGLLNN